MRQQIPDFKAALDRFVNEARAQTGRDLRVDDSRHYARIVEGTSSWAFVGPLCGEIYPPKEDDPNDFSLTAVGNVHSDQHGMEALAPNGEIRHGRRDQKSKVIPLSGSVTSYRTSTLD
jgi:hypothetical protein